MKTLQLFQLALFVAFISTSVVYGQSKADYMAFMNKTVGEWHLDQNRSQSQMPNGLPNMIMTYKLEGETGVRELKMKTPDGNWQSLWVYNEKFDAGKNKLMYSGSHPQFGAYNGTLTVAGDKATIEERTADNKLMSIIKLSFTSPSEMIADVEDYYDLEGNFKDSVTNTFKMVMIKQ